MRRNHRARKVARRQSGDARAVGIGQIKLSSIVQADQDDLSVTRVAGGKQEGYARTDEAYRDETLTNANDDAGRRVSIETCGPKDVGKYTRMESRRILALTAIIRELCAG